MRLIDADLLKGRFIHGRFDDVYISEKEVQDAPTVDAVPVVRCKDCKFYPDGDGTTKWVPCREIIIQPKWYCADGERVDDGKN